MKKQPKLRTILVVVMVGFSIINSGYGRQIFINYIHSSHDAYIEDTNTIYEPSVGTNTLRLNNINVHAIRDFLYRFNGVSNETWYGVEGGLVAKFKIGNVVTSVTYKKNGEWLYTIHSYDEKVMPEEVRTLVIRTYQAYVILHIEEIEVPKQGNPIYLVYIQNATTIKILRVCEGEMEVLHDYIRG